MFTVGNVFTVLACVLLFGSLGVIGCAALFEFGLSANTSQTRYDEEALAGMSHYKESGVSLAVTHRSSDSRSGRGTRL